MQPRERFTWIAQLSLPFITSALAICTLYGAFFYAAREKVMGDVQRIFYFHAPAGIICFLAFTVTFVASIGYLITRKRIWDIVAHASVEIGMVLTSIVLLTGPLWARPIWGIYWTGEARLTSTLILWLIYAGYLMVRRYTDNPDQQARFAAVLGIVGFLDVPIVYWSVNWWRGHHPIVLKVSGGGGMEPTMRVVFLMGIFTYISLYLCMMAFRVPLGVAAEELRWLSERAADSRNSTPASQPTRMN